MSTTEKYDPSGNTVLALTDVGADFINFGELVLSGSISGSSTSVVATSAIPAYWPQVGFITIDTEIIKHTSWAGSTFTVTGGRGQESANGASAATSHADGAKIGLYNTALRMNQMLAEIIAIEKARWNPNLVLNSDFSRRTVFGLAMPEVLADTLGYHKIDVGSVPTVSVNILTFGAANNELSWPKGAAADGGEPSAWVWRDGRASATFKATSTTGLYWLKWRIDVNNYVTARMNNGQFEIVKVVAGTPTTMYGGANALTLNRWYWLELEKQGTVFIAKIYDTGGTVPGVTKASSTIMAAGAPGAVTVADAGIQVGAHISITSDQAAAQWGGIATGNGGVYVETWLPESWTVNFAGTLGGQAFGFDESADSGPLGKQWAPRVYLPAISRRVYGGADYPDGGLNPSVAYTASVYTKVAGKGGSGVLGELFVLGETSALGNTTTWDLQDAGETSWTRKTSTLTNPSTTRRFSTRFDVGLAGTASGTFFFQLPQLEQGSAATAWRNAPADDAPIVWEFKKLTDSTTTSATTVEVDARDLAGNIFLPWDASVIMTAGGAWFNSGVNAIAAGASIDGVFADSLLYTRDTIAAANAVQSWSFHRRTQQSAGKHRFSLGWLTAAGTATMRGASTEPAVLQIIAYRGK